MTNSRSMSFHLSMSQLHANGDTAPALGSNGPRSQPGHSYYYQQQSSQVTSPSSAAVPVPNFSYYTGNAALSATPDSLNVTSLAQSSFDFVSPAFTPTTTTVTNTNTNTNTTYGSVDPIVLPRRPSVLGSNIDHTQFQVTQNTVPVIAAHPPQMRYLHNDLAVLSAEQYDDGCVTKRHGSVPTRTARRDRSSQLNASNPKKRGRKPSEEGPDETEEETKRSRGRPRLDTTDQTPSERRRTQIRLAQRAYRNRKETAISDLEAKVNDLKEANQEIRNAYQDILDCASQFGIVAQVPEFGRQLKKFQDILAKRAKEAKSPGSDEASRESDSDEIDLAREDGTARKDSSGADGGSWPDPTGSRVLKSNHSHPKPVYAGIMVSQEPVAQPHMPKLPRPGSAQYDIITEPTSENASFACNVAFDTGFIDPPYIPNVHSLWSSLPGPSSMAANEWTFSRRLHRRATERAVGVLMSPNPPPAVVNRVFGFVRLFETMDEIRTRMLGVLARMRSEPLNNWKQPFHHVGGAGTHYANKGVPNAYLDSAPFTNSGYGMGPFNEPTMRVRDTYLSTSQYVSKLGWEGTWFDSYEVETYLMHNGIILPVTADLQTVDLPPDSMFQRQGPGQTATARWQQQAREHPPPDLGLASGIPTTTASPTMGYDGATYPSPVSSADGVGMAPVPAAVASAPAQDTWQSLSTGTEWVPSTMAAFEHNPMCFADGTTSQFLFPPNEAAAPRRFLLNVENFIEAAVSRASCLGRSACFRPTDIVTAFWEAVVEE